MTPVRYNVFRLGCQESWNINELPSTVEIDHPYVMQLQLKDLKVMPLWPHLHLRVPLKESLPSEL